MAKEPESRALAGRDPVTERHTGVSRAPPSWGSRLDLTMVSPAEDVLGPDYEEDEEEDALAFLLSESDEQEEDTFMSPAQAAKPEASAVLPGDSTPASPGLSMDLQAVCKRAAARLNVPWPEMAKETSRSRYEGTHLPQAAGIKRQLLPVFPEMLDEVSVSWRDRPFCNKVPIQGASSIDCDGMEKLGLLCMPPMEPLVAAHLLLKMGPSPSRNPTLPAKSDRFQSAFSARALNVSSLLTAYQAELCEDLSGNPGVATLDEMAAVTDICLGVQRCAVQATDKVMGIMVVQERARWLNLTTLPDREKEDVLDMPIVPEGIFGSALASMQRRCETKKREDEALHLCVPRRVQPLLSQQQSSAQAASNSARFKTPKTQRSQPTPSPQPRLETRASWPRTFPVPAAAQAQPTQNFGQQSRKKKRAV
ncbi:hypothetical protein CesoFtcFv8_021122 [Champsocephalus esox]|nr:hypothetical protein CesoFtcFv8_021122 [Champsocephalus esox]